jgi:hypothetical protein
MTSVFISYAREDQPFVRRLDAALESGGRGAWVDWEGIPPTADWMAEIRRAIDGAEAAVFIISPDWVASRVCGLELEHAAQQGKRLIPVVWRESDRVPDALSRLNWVWLRESDDFDANFAKLVAALDTDLEWVRAHTRLLVRAQEWQDGAEEARLLRGRDLDDAERWLADSAHHSDPAPVPLQTDFITRSRRAARRRQRLAFGAVAVALVVSLVLTAWAVVERGRAIDNAQAAQASEKDARDQEAKAREQEQLARSERERAEQREQEARVARDGEAKQRAQAQRARTEAERQRDEAERQRDEAVRQRTAALARQLAARAEAQVSADPALLQKAALMVAESQRLVPNGEADAQLRRYVGLMPRRHAELEHSGIADATAIAGNGQFVAFIERGRTLRVIDAGTLRETFRYQSKDRRRVEHVGVHPGGHFVVLAGEREDTVLIDTRSGAERVIAQCNAVGVAFGGRGDERLALGCRRGVRLLDLANPEVAARELPSDGGQQMALAFDRAGERVAGVDGGGVIRGWRVSDGQLLGEVQTQRGPGRWSGCCIGFIAFSASGDYVVAGNAREREVMVVATREWREHARLPHDAVVNVFAFDERQDLLATGDRSGRVTVWRVPEQRVIARMAHAGQITHLRLHASPDSGGDRTAELLSASTDRTARVWDPFTGAELARASHPTAVVWVQRPWAPHFGARIVSVDNRTGLAQWQSRPPALPLAMPVGRGGERVWACTDPGSGRHFFADAWGVRSWDETLRFPVQDGGLFFAQRGAPVAIDER